MNQVISFRSQYDERFNKNNRFFNVSGERYKKQYVLDYDKEGCQCLKECGCIDIVEEIQSHRESCDLSLILSRLDPMQVNGMMSTYTFDDLVKSEVIDITSLPTNAGEMLNLVKRGKDMFNGLPVEIRERFNFSAEKFISMFGTNEFADIINDLNAKMNNVPNVSFTDEIVENDDDNDVEKPKKRGRPRKEVKDE